MLPRERIAEIERMTLGEHAKKAEDSAGRAVYEKPCDFRTDFQRDRDRIIHCRAFRRLKHKTQVFLIPQSDHCRTRLTHTLEVSQISRTVSRALRLNEDLTEAIALGHDLGHTPFGHDGERVLDALLKREGIADGFKHNLQSKRIVEIIEKDGKGLNLTAEVIDGIACHTGEMLPATHEGMVVRFCDKIAYINHDIEDAIRGGVITQEMLPKEPLKVLGETKTQRITTLVRSLVENSGAVVHMSDEVQAAQDELRQFMFRNVYRSGPAVAEKDKASRIVEFLFDFFMDNPDRLSPLYKALSERFPLPVAVADFISGMTDDYAVNFFKDIYIPKGWNGIEEHA